MDEKITATWPELPADTKAQIIPRQTRIVMVDFASGANGDFVAIAAALQRQVQEHFACAPPYGWGLSAAVRFTKDANDVAPSEWVLGLYAHPDQPGALGYHDRNGSTPLMKIFPQLDMKDGVPWSTTASHEILETLLDPELSRCVQAPSGHFWALEVCDFVENDTYDIDGIPVSNFSLPSAFEPPEKAINDVKYDWMHLSTSPFQIRPGGYGQWWDGKKWVQALAGTKNPARRMLDLWRTSRGARRAAFHSQFTIGHPEHMMNTYVPPWQTKSV